jgi:hypothetical protein
MEVDVDDYIAEDVTAIGHPCYDACKVQVMEGARTEREALCSAEGLRATRESKRRSHPSALYPHCSLSASTYETGE